MTFVFLHVGPEVRFPTLLTRSIRFHLPDAEIIQCADGTTPAIEGVTRVHRHDGDIGNLMTFRLSAFGSLGLTGEAAYIDTDMLLIRPFDVAETLGEAEVAVCERTYGKDDPINANLFGLDFSEYANRTFGEVYPYLACFTAVRGHRFWQDCFDELQRLPEKFWRWYGDQEAIRNVVRRGGYRVAAVPESRYGCLPEFMKPSVEVPCLLHFKGLERKEVLLQWAKRLNLGRA